MIGMGLARTSDCCGSCWGPTGPAVRKTPFEKVVAGSLNRSRRRVDGSTEARTDLFSRGENAVWVRYDDYECVVDVHASNELTPFQPTREGAIDALEYRPGD
jgi:hypothetical protein